MSQYEAALFVECSLTIALNSCYPHRWAHAHSKHCMSTQSPHRLRISVLFHCQWVAPDLCACGMGCHSSMCNLQSSSLLCWTKKKNLTAEVWMWHWETRAPHKSVGSRPWSPAVRIWQTWNDMEPQKFVLSSDIIKHLPYSRSCGSVMMEQQLLDVRYSIQLQNVCTYSLLCRMTRELGTYIDKFSTENHISLHFFFWPVV